MERSRNLPDADRLSVLAATILLAYALAHFLSLPVQEYSVQLPGFFLSFRLNLSTIIAILAGGLTATGARWLIYDHPRQQGGTYQHWILPALTALVFAIPLFELPLGLGWWALFVGSGMVLTLVMIAEYVVVDPEDVRYSLAAAVLNAVSFALFLILAIVLRDSRMRLYLELPAIGLAVFWLSARSLNLRTHGRWLWWEAISVSLITMQIAAAFHYWPAAPISYGLAILGPAYAITSLYSRLAEGEPLRQAVLEPIIVMIIAWGAAIWLR